MIYDGEGDRPHGAFFTHLEPAWQKKFDEVASKIDYAVCLNKTIKKYLEDKGVKTEIIRHGHDPRIKKEPVFGWCGRVYKSGRKGEDLIEKIGGVIQGNFENAVEFYKKIDYLIIPSRIEGGPVPLIDAISAGVPVIAREGLGWCDEFPCIRYKDDEDILRVINQLRNPPTWEEWKEKHRKLFDEISKLW